jgi:hypothetical protein
LLNESRRRAYLDAMQVVGWLPRTPLPFAAPSRPQALLTPVPLAIVPPPSPAAPAVAAAAAARPVERPRIEIPRPSSRPAAPVPAEPVVKAVPPPAPVPAPRFALQLLRTGNCLVLAELPTGQPFQSRDPGYLLLKDLLRAAGLPDSPQLIGEPVRWPLLQRGNLDQGPQEARDFVQGFILARSEETPSVCLWLIGLAAVRYAGEGEAEDYQRELQVPGIGPAWALPSLELLMEEPHRKADVWRAMRQSMPRWKTTE